MRRVLAFVHSLQRQATSPTDYGKGYRDALTAVEEYIDELMWESGVDADEDD